MARTPAVQCIAGVSLVRASGLALVVYPESVLHDTNGQCAADVIRGAADRVRVNGIDRWFGGVHLQGHDAPWRWDGTTLVRSAPL
jgi:hypothetical protein